MTQIIKGVAMIVMIIHHSISNNPGLPVELSRGNVTLLIGTAAKVCVCLFTILSGYGITVSWERAKEHKGFVRKHIIKLWLSFVFVYAFCVVWKTIQGASIAGVYGNGITGFLYFLKDIAGLQNFIIETPTLVRVWWYMETIFICYILFPLFYRIICKSRAAAIGLLMILYTPWVVYQIRMGWGWHTDRELFYLFSFALGMICARYHILDGLAELSSKRRAVCSICSAAAMLAVFLLRSRLCLIADPFWALSIIAFCICSVAAIPVFSDALSELGTVSSDMYMFHSVVLSSMRALSFTILPFRVLFVVCLSWGIALFLKRLKDLIHYPQLIALVTSRIVK